MTTTTTHTIASPTLDPITIIIQDFEPGRGEIIVKCFDCAWTAFWGSTGNDSIADFLKRVSANYVANNLIRGRRQWISNKRQEEREFAYLLKVAQAIVDAAKGGAL